MPARNTPRRPGGPGGPRRPGAAWRLPQIWAASTVEPLPVVTTIGASVQVNSDGTEAVSVTLVGSINTNGLDSTVWFDYGLDPTLGTLTAVVSAPASTMPQTFTIVLTNLDQGSTYHFSFAGSSDGGTVTGNQLTFVYGPPADTPTSSSQTVQSMASGSVSIPHLAWPFTIVSGTAHTGIRQSNDGAIVAQQDSDDDIFACVSAVLACEVGEWPEGPGFGIYDQAFSPVEMDQDGLPEIDTIGITSTVTRWEPRATTEIIARAVNDDPSAGEWTVALTV